MRKRILNLKWLFLGIIFFSYLLAGFGCAQKQLEIKDTSYEKWRVMAEKSTGHSPVARKRTVGQVDESGNKAMEDKTDAEEGITLEEEPQKPLPTKKMTMKMRNVDIAVLLRAMARIANQNIVINDNIKGNVNINVENANWDEVFLSALSSNGLTYAWIGSIIRIISLEDMKQDVALLKAEQDKSAASKEYQLSKIAMKAKAERLDPLVTKVIHVDYADPQLLKENLWEFLKVAHTDGESTSEQINVRGAILVDKHTNSLMIQATRVDLERLLPLVEKLDRPTPQILIKAQIVETSSDIARELGVQWGGGIHNTSGNNNSYITAGANSSGILGSDLDTVISPTTGNIINLPTTSTETGLTIGYAAQKLGDNILSLQLSALQEEGKLNILSSPTITTLDNMTAIIESGKEVPYQTVDSDGEIEIEYKKAVIRMEVTPHVIAGEELMLDIRSIKDDLDWANAVDGNPAISTKEAETSVVIFDGSTTVIGGLSKETNTSSKSGVPILQDLPILGVLFRGDSDSKEMEEVLIFITPHILKEVEQARVGDDDNDNTISTKPQERIRFKP